MGAAAGGGDVGDADARITPSPSAARRLKWSFSPGARSTEPPAPSDLDRFAFAHADLPPARSIRRDQASSHGRKHPSHRHPGLRNRIPYRGVRRQRSLDRPGGLNKGEFLAHRNVHRSEDETANPSIEGTTWEGCYDNPTGAP